jgi:protein O-GlcNAc transferase
MSGTRDLLQRAQERLAQGRPGEAEPLLRKVLALEPGHAEARYELGGCLIALDRLDEAASELETTSRQVSGNAAVMLRLADLRFRQGRMEEAAEDYRRTLALNSNIVSAHNNLGNTLLSLSRHADAAESYRHAVRLAPDRPEPLNNLGVALLGLGDAEQAAQSFRKAVGLRPGFAAAWTNLGQALIQVYRFEEAEEAIRRALAVEPMLPEAHNTLGNLLMGLNRKDEAFDAFSQAVLLRPAYPEAHVNLGRTKYHMGLFDEAERHYRHALAHDVNFAPAYDALGLILQLRGRAIEAVAYHERAIALRPGFADARVNLGNALTSQGRIVEAKAAYRAALDLEPDDSVAHQNLLLCLNYDEGLKAETLYKESRKWGETFGRVEALPAVAIKREAAKREAGQRLKVGFVSPDFRRHSVAYFLEPLLEGLEGAGIEITLYSDVARPDEVTERLKGLAAHWRDLTGLGDHQAAERVRSDGIDILIDLAGHTAGNRLLMFAHQPAPVQASWLGYPATTGLAAIGWRITDAIADPEGDADGLHTERLARLPGFLCYRPDEDAPELYEPPSRSNGYVTFGSFNALAKLSERDIRLMAKLLSRVEGSRLLLKARPLADSGVRARVIERFARAGVGSERLDLLGHAESVEGHLGLYAKIDVALDPVHYNGTTTTCEALWMGVPVVTLAGDRHASRVGASLLTKAGLPELVTASEEDYLATAQGLAGDAKKLAGLRHDLRTRLIASPLLDRKRFAQSFAEAMHLIWNEEAAQSPG